jgi:restriction system protein
MDINFLKTLRPVFVLLFVVLAVRFILPEILERLTAYFRSQKGKKWRSDQDLLSWLRGMKPKEFEEYIADLFSRMGYKTKVVGGAYDEGVDVIAEKDGIRHHIQCKKFITKEVGPSAIRDFYGAIANKLADGKSYFVTTNKFTLEAERFAEDKPIELVDGFKLIKYIRLAEKNIKKREIKSLS